MEGCVLEWRVVWFDVCAGAIGRISVRGCVVEDARAAGADGCSIAVFSSGGGAMGEADGGELGGAIAMATGTGGGTASIGGDVAMGGGIVGAGAGEIGDGCIGAMIEGAGA